jgi:hypothetical protein
VKERPILFKDVMVRAILVGRKTQTRRIAKPRYDDKTPCDHWMAYAPDFIRRHCAHGSEGQTCPYGQPGDRLWVRETWAINPDDGGAVYRATDPDWEVCECWTWRPSIHMPRWASRITLEITAVRVERLQGISLDDAKAEGVETTDQYAELWCRINGAESWYANPWVWVVAFKRVEGGGK